MSRSSSFFIRRMRNWWCIRHFQTSMAVRNMVRSLSIRVVPFSCTHPIVFSNRAKQRRCREGLQLTTSTWFRRETTAESIKLSSHLVLVTGTERLIKSSLSYWGARSWSTKIIKSSISSSPRDRRFFIGGSYICCGATVRNEWWVIIYSNEYNHQP